MQFGLKRLISVMLLFAWLSTLFASGLPKDSNPERQVSLMRSILVSIKNAPSYPVLFARQLANGLWNQVQIDQIAIRELVELFRVTGGY